MNAYTAITAAPLEALADQIKLLNDRERLLLIDWLADGFDDECLGEHLYDGISAAMDEVAQVLPDRPLLDYPDRFSRPARWTEYKSARDDRLNLRMRVGR